MQRWLITVESNCTDSSREKDFNEWYDAVHVPEIMETPGMVRAVRYENTNPQDGEGKFVAAYEIETDDLETTLAKFTEIVDSMAKEGRLSDLLIAVGGGFYRQLSAFPKEQ
jgi:hypothetical protein